jgi:hypothetical protein
MKGNEEWRVVKSKQMTLSEDTENCMVKTSTTDTMAKSRGSNRAGNTVHVGKLVMQTRVR